jgi:hypothetical protein
MNLRDVLGLRPKGDSAAALRTALAETQEALASVRGVASALEAQRGAVLLDAGPDEAEAHERKLAEATAEAGRLAAMAAALPARIADAEARERGAELDALSERAEAEAEEAAMLVPGIVRALDVAAELIQRHDALAQRVWDANRELRAEGRDRVALPLRRAWPHDPRGARPVTLAPHLRLPGPEGGCDTVEAWRAALRRVQALAED